MHNHEKKYHHSRSAVHTCTFALGDFFSFGILDPRKADILCMWWFRHFICHLQEEQVCDLFQVVAIAYTVIPQDVGEIPGFGDKGGFVCHGLSTSLSCHLLCLCRSSSSVSNQESLTLINNTLSSLLFPHFIFYSLNLHPHFTPCSLSCSLSCSPSYGFDCRVNCRLSCRCSL